MIKYITIIACSFAFSADGIAQTAAEYYQQANDFRTQRNWQKAVSLYDLAIQKDSTYAPAYQNKASTLFELGKQEQALQVMQKAVSLQPKSSTVYVERGKLQIRREYYENAILDFDEAIELQPQSIAAYYYRGEANLAAEHPEVATKDFGKVVELLSLNSDVTTKQYPKLYTNLGFAQRLTGDFEWAIVNLQKAIVLNPNDAEAYYHLGVIKSGSRDYNLGIMNFDKALQLDNKYTIAFYQRGLAHYSNKNYKAAIQDFSSVLVEAPASNSAYIARGYAYADLGKHKNAIKDYDAALALAPNDDATFIRKGFSQMALKDYTAAQATFGKAVDLDGKYKPFAYNNRAEATYKLGKYDQALEDINTSISIDSLNAHAYYNRAVVYSHKGRFALILSAPQSASSQEDSPAGTIDHNRLAQRDFDRAIELNNQVAAFYFDRADLYYRKGLYEAAIADWNRVQELDPKYKTKETKKALKAATKKFMEG